jgi:hypothetical protein
MVEDEFPKETNAQTDTTVPEIKSEEITPVLKEEEVKSDKPVQKSKFHCFSCETKVGYLGFLCKCEYIFCGKHRHFSEHSCTFDFRAYDRQKLAAKK